jgi:hypothetical protein
MVAGEMFQGRREYAVAERVVADAQGFGSLKSDH